MILLKLFIGSTRKGTRDLTAALYSVAISVLAAKTTGNVMKTRNTAEIFWMCGPAIAKDVKTAFSWTGPLSSNISPLATAF